MINVLVKIRTASIEDAKSLLARVNNNELAVRGRYPTSRCTHDAELRLKYECRVSSVSLENFKRDMRKALRDQLGLELSADDIIVDEV